MKKIIVLFFLFGTLIGCTEYDAINETKDGVFTRYGKVIINHDSYPNRLLISNKEVDLGEINVIELIKLWNFENETVLLVSHSNTNRCERVYKLISLNRISFKSSDSFGNCDIPSNYSVDNEVIKIKFKKNQSQPELNVEFSNGILKTSSGNV